MFEWKSVDNAAVHAIIKHGITLLFFGYWIHIDSLLIGRTVTNPAIRYQLSIMTLF